jgi:2-polyprenyl-3-methyl-5-hydroxy-6-metoxy-1,4-benzoquinol methylase
MNTDNIGLNAPFAPNRAIMRLRDYQTGSSARMSQPYRYYQVSLDEELAQVGKAVEYYYSAAEEISQSSTYSAGMTHYYRKAIDAPNASLRFRALFFAMRLQPVLTYIAEFVRAQRRPPYILDLGCGFGLESTLICLSGAKVHGIDGSRDKIDGARERQAAYEEAYQKKLDLSYDLVNLFKFHPTEPYDAVYSSATLHHIEPAGEATKVISGLIKPGGYFFLSDENGYSLPQQLVVQRRIGWRTPRKYWTTDEETGEKFLYGHENIRAPFQWTGHMRKAGLEPQSIKYCRFLPPIDWPIERLVKTERLLRGVPLVAQAGAIGFLLTANKPF